MALLKAFGGYRDVLTWNVVWLSASSAVLGVASAFYSWLLPLLAYRVGAEGLVASIYTAAFAAAAVMSLVGGVIADSLGRRAAVILFAAMYPPAFVLAMAGGPLGLLAAALLIAVASNAAYPATTALLGESVPEDKVGRAFSLRLMMATAGYAVGSAALGYMAVGGVQAALLACLAASLAVLAMRALLRETLRRGGGTRTALATLKAASSSLLRRRMGQLLVTSAAVSSVGAGVLNVYLAVFLGEALGLSEPEVGLVYSAATVAGAAAVPLVGPLVDRLGGFASIAASSVAVDLVVVALALLPHLGLHGPEAFPAVLALWIFESLSSAVNQVANSRWAVEVTRQETRGTVTSALGLPSYIGQTAGPAFGAILWGTSPSTALLGAAAVGLASLVPFAAAWRLWRRGERL